MREVPDPGATAKNYLIIDDRSGMNKNIIVLPGVDEKGTDVNAILIVIGTNSTDERGDFHEIGTRARYKNPFPAWFCSITHNITPKKRDSRGTGTLFPCCVSEDRNALHFF